MYSPVKCIIDPVYSWFLIINVECDLQVFLPLVTMFLTLSFKLPPSINCDIWLHYDNSMGVYTVQCEACRVMCI